MVMMMRVHWGRMAAFSQNQILPAKKVLHKGVFHLLNPKKVPLNASDEDERRITKRRFHIRKTTNHLPSAS